MIVVVSDLHLQHTSLDRIRWKEEGATRELDVRRNVSAGPLQMLLAMVDRNARRVGAREIHVVFAGDIFEIYRSPRWFLGGQPLRPTRHPASDELRGMVDTILDDIAIDCGDFFKALDDAVNLRPLKFRGEAFSLPVKPTIHYLPGNHDRLVNLFPDIRKKARKLLCMGESEERFPHHFQPPDGYGILVRHGHEYDRYNFAAEFGGAEPERASYDQPTFGDYVTVDVATRLAVAFRAHHAQRLRQGDEEGKLYRSVYAALTEFDDIRPATSIIEYLATLVRGRDGEVTKMLRPVLLDVYETARADPFFLSEAKRLGLGTYFDQPVAVAVETVLKNFSADSLGKLVGVLMRLRSAAAGPAAAASKEAAVADGKVDIIIAGHTHRPDHVSIPAIHRRSAAGPGVLEAYQGMYLDTGTWRTRIDEGVGDTFGRVRAYTMVQCYRDDELRAHPEISRERRRFESWTGHLASDAYGPRVDDVTFAEPSRPQRVHVVDCRIEHIDEGDTLDGGELELHFGVDASATVVHQNGVHDGTTLPIGVDLTVDPSLDGEVWCWGLEKDCGSWFWDRDDALPWAVDILPREGEPPLGKPDRPFETGRRRLVVSNNRGSSFVVRYEVRDAD